MGEKMIDTHAHIFAEYYDDLDLEIKKIFETNKFVINIGSDESSCIEIVALSRKYQYLYASVGLHPTEMGDFGLIEKLALDDKVIAIGETGLDYFHDSNKQEQIFLFEKHMKLAQKIRKPVIIHSRDATEDTISVLKRFPQVKGIIHCFSGNLEEAQKYISLGYKLGIGGIVTFKNSCLKEVLKKIPIHNIVIETDCPYLTPEPYRGKKNHSYYIKYIYEKVADIYDISTAQLEKEIYHNTVQIFDKLR